MSVSSSSSAFLPSSSSSPSSPSSSWSSPLRSFLFLAFDLALALVAFAAHSGTGLIRSHWRLSRRSYSTGVSAVSPGASRSLRVSGLSSAIVMWLVDAAAAAGRSAGSDHAEVLCVVAVVGVVVAVAVNLDWYVDLG